jgi:hypothetical protein
MTGPLSVAGLGIEALSELANPSLTLTRIGPHALRSGGLSSLPDEVQLALLQEIGLLPSSSLASLVRRLTLNGNESTIRLRTISSRTTTLLYLSSNTGAPVLRQGHLKK